MDNITLPSVRQARPLNFLDIIARLRDSPRWTDPQIGDALWRRLVALHMEFGDETWARAQRHFQPTRITFDAQSGTVFWFHENRDVSIYRAEVAE